MSLALNRENFFWHKLHSLTGIVPVGYYMVQHLVLNSFSLAGPGYFNGVINFFDGMPWFFLLTVELLLIWIPLAFHAIYGIFIAFRAKYNYFETKYGWSQNRMFTLQRWSGIYLFFFLIYHVLTTTGAKYLNHDSHLIKYDAMHDNFVGHYYLLLVVYAIGVAAASYHFSYGIWNFCIRWGITISETAQAKVQKFSFVCFIALTLVGWGALAGFLIHPKQTEEVTMRASHGTRLAIRNGQRGYAAPLDEPSVDAGSWPLT